MSTIEKKSSGANYTAVTVGQWAELSGHILHFSPQVQVAGKVFVGQAIGATGAELSFQEFAAGGGSAFLHAHQTHEELYVFLEGAGEFVVDGQVFAVGQGSVVRVAPQGQRAVRNIGNDPLVMLCVQYKADSFDQTDQADGVLLDEPVVWC